MNPPANSHFNPSFSTGGRIVGNTLRVGWRLRKAKSDVSASVMEGTSTPTIPGFGDLTVIGHGSTATVYRARQEGFDREVAIKVLNVDISDRRAQKRFQRERSLNGQLSDHPNVVTVLDSGFVDGRYPYLAMEFFEQGSLADQLRSNGPFDVALVLHIGVRIAGALETAHRLGVLHRDVKPHNILMSRFGEPALADFGIAAILELEQSMTAALTPIHAAPELLEGAEPTPQSDVYALGSTLYTLLAGAPPFAGPPGEGMLSQLLRISTTDVPTLVRGDMPDGLMELLRSTMAKRPHDRVASAEAVGERLREVQLGLKVTVSTLPVETNSNSSAREPLFDDRAVDANAEILDASTAARVAHSPVAQSPIAESSVVESPIAESSVVESPVVQSPMADSFRVESRDPSPAADLLNVDVNSPSLFDANLQAWANTELDQTPSLDSDVPETVQRNAPETVQRNAPETVQRNAPETVQRNAPANVQGNVPANVESDVHANAEREATPRAGEASAKLERQSPAQIDADSGTMTFSNHAPRPANPSIAPSDAPQKSASSNKSAVASTPKRVEPIRDEAAFTVSAKQLHPWQPLPNVEKKARWPWFAAIGGAIAGAGITIATFAVRSDEKPRTNIAASNVSTTIAGNNSANSSTTVTTTGSTIPPTTIDYTQFAPADVSVKPAANGVEVRFTDRTNRSRQHLLKIGRANDQSPINPVITKPGDAFVVLPLQIKPDEPICVVVSAIIDLSKKTFAETKPVCINGAEPLT
jgi:serine/threonine protein kinase